MSKDNGFFGRNRLNDLPGWGRPSGRIFAALLKFLRRDGWKFTVLKEGIAVLSFRGTAGTWQCFTCVDEAKGWLSFFSIFPANVPSAKRSDVAEYLTRANYGLVIGNFEMDYDDGEVRFKTSIDVEGGELTSVMVENVVRTNLVLMDRYFPGLMGVLYGDRDPADAIEEVEGRAPRSLDEGDSQPGEEGFRSPDDGEDN
jgi:hypothetical protein